MTTTLLRLEVISKGFEDGRANFGVDDITLLREVAGERVELVGSR